jgi:hypothetical protein
MRADDQDKSAPAPKEGARPIDKLFLGPEFLTWLYFFLESEGFEATVSGELVRFAIGKRTVLSSPEEGARVALSGPDLDDSGELLQAVRRGALIDVLSLQMAMGERVYEFALTSDGGISGLKLPDLMTGEDGEGGTGARRPDAADILDLRMMAHDDVETVVDDLFSRFVTRRLAGAWQSEDLRSMRRAVATGLKARLAKV